jgi:hypothetical protein
MDLYLPVMRIYFEKYSKSVLMSIAFANRERVLGKNSCPNGTMRQKISTFISPPFVKED